jgi:hypothetical protein
MVQLRVAGAKPGFFLLLALIVVGVASVDGAIAGGPAVRIFSGEARHPKTGELLYTEHHSRRVSSDGSIAIESEYRDAAGATFATRSVRLAATGYLPAYAFRDGRTDFEEGIRIDDGNAVMYRRRGEHRPIEERPVPEDGTPVADAGFERLILHNWDRLAAGERVEAVLAVPSRLRAFRFVVTMVGASTIGGVPVITYRMSFSNPLLRLLAPKLLVSYHRDDRTIIAFEGASNIEKAGGGHYNVSVRYADELMDTRAE